MNPNIEIKPFTYKHYTNCNFVVDRYRNNKNLAILIERHTDDPYEPIDRIAVCTLNTDIKLNDEHVAIKDYSENCGMVDFMADEMKLIEKKPCQQIESGFVTIGIHKLTPYGFDYLQKCVRDYCEPMKKDKDK